MIEITPTSSLEADAAPEGTPRRSRRPRGTGARRAALAVVPLALLGSGALIYQASNAAFTASTATGSNSWTAGNVFVTNSSAGSALFSVSALKPTTQSAAATANIKCVTVNYTGNLAANVRLYLTGYSSTLRPAGPPGPLAAGTNDLGDYLRVIVEEGSGTQADCSDFVSSRYLTSGTTNGQSMTSLKTALTAFSSTYPGPSNTSWAPSGAAAKTYKVTYWLPDIGEVGAPTQTVLDDLQNTSLSTAFTWEAQNS